MLCASCLGNLAHTRDNLVYPLASKADPLWPLVKITQGYEIRATVSGTMVVEDSTYHYTQDKGMSEPTTHLEDFSYQTYILTDVRGNRAAQTMFDQDGHMVSAIVEDFANARIAYFNEYQQCNIVQYRDSLMTIGQVLRAIWAPNDHSYRGF